MYLEKTGQLMRYKNAKKEVKEHYNQVEHTVNSEKLCSVEHLYSFYDVSGLRSNMLVSFWTMGIVAPLIFSCLHIFSLSPL